MTTEERVFIEAVRSALRELIETATPFAKQNGNLQEKALWSDIQWARTTVEKINQRLKGQ